MASNTENIATVQPDIPFTTFLGTLKQLQTDSLDDKQRYALDAVLPSFRELDEYLTLRDWGVVNTGLGSKVLYVGRGRERRYAGDKTLGRGCYFSVCNDSAGQDYGTLLSELKAYFSYRSKMPCQIYDSTVDNGAASSLGEFHHSPIS